MSTGSRGRSRDFAVAVALALAAVGPGACDKKKDGGTAVAPVSDKPAPVGSGVVQGTVKLVGSVPAPVPWGGTSTASCRSLHDPTIQLVNVSDGKLADVFVWVKVGEPAGTYPVPPTPVTVDQKGCEFHPRVFGIRAGQPLEGVNSDGFLHNISSPDFNAAFPIAGSRKLLDIHTEGVMVTLKCDVHGWMRAYAGVVNHPYFAVTGSDGAFSIKGLVDGDYVLGAWHETLGTQEQAIKVVGGAPASITFAFKN